jgi:glycosyltransferase involved in cell wall biosynthesis
MNQCVVDCARLRSEFDDRVFALHYASSIADIGSFRPGKLVLLVRYAVRLNRELRRFRPELVYFVPAVTGFSFFRDFLIAMIVKRFPCQLVYHLHGKGIAQKAARPLNRAIYAAFFRNAFVIHLSARLFGDIATVVDRSMCRFLPNGIELDAKSSVSNEERSGSKVPVILYLSNLVPSKGPMVLLDACSLLKDRKFEFKANFVGNPSKNISAACFNNEILKRKLEDCVTFLGPKYGDEKKIVLSSADIFAFPTYYNKECFPLILLEAMAASLPIVTTDEGAIADIIEDGETGYLAEKENPKQLADKLEHLIRNPGEAKEMGRRGFIKFKRDYTLDRFYDNLINILSECSVNRSAIHSRPSISMVLKK